MNDNNDPQSNVAFNTNTSPDTQASTNPFTGDLKGEFSSDFGTNTNAVSQIFKSGSFSSENRTKYIAIGVLVLAVIGGLLFFMGDPASDSPFDEEFADEVDDGVPEDATDVDEENIGDLEEDDELGEDDDLLEEDDAGDEALAEDGPEEEANIGDEDMADSDTMAEADAPSEAPMAEPAAMSTGAFTIS